MPGHVVVLVLGDVGRSPRMQYHSLSLAERAEVDRVSVVGLKGERCMSSVETHPKIHFALLGPAPFQRVPRGLFPLFAPIKVLWQICQLLWTLLFALPPADVILVQNPPCIPTFIVALAAARWHGGSLVIDWHNLGYTILSLSLAGSRHAWVVDIARNYEHWFAKLADQHLCVTHAFKSWLAHNFGLPIDSITVLHDKAPAHFAALSMAEKHNLVKRLEELNWPELQDTTDDDNGHKRDETLFTSKSPTGDDDTQVVEKPNRPTLVISSTSWTPDEDFGVLLDSITQLDERIKDDPGMAPVLFAITGKGPQKQFYLDKVAKLELSKTRIVSLWLESEDYPKLVGAADLGVCLHTSSSGIDLPMKVLDMFGAGVPVCAYDYPCLADELVKDNVNGRTFTTSTQLATQLHELLADGRAALGVLRENLAKENRERVTWERHWNEVAWPVVSKAFAAGRRALSSVFLKLCIVVALLVSCILAALLQ